VALTRALQKACSAPWSSARESWKRGTESVNRQRQRAPSTW